jgi:hypothetical protein
MDWRPIASIVARKKIAPTSRAVFRSAAKFGVFSPAIGHMGGFGRR